MDAQPLEPKSKSLASLEVRAAAAAWLGRLRSDARTAEDQRDFKLWLSESALHRAVWEQMSDRWEAAHALRPDRARITAELQAKPGSAFRTPRWVAVSAAASLVAISIAAAMYFTFQPDTLSSRIGEHRVVRLEDGTQLELNTNTQVDVRYDDTTRQVVLRQGEALFDVAFESTRPFIVRAGDRQIRALGTAFLVRQDDMAGTSITLMKGKVVVSPVEASAASPPAEILAPGQRLIFPPKGPAQRDLPAIDRLIAWQQGEVSFYATPLPQAVAEMNRYSARHIVLDAPDMEDQKLTGLYRAGDSADFAHGVAGSFGLRLVEEGAILRLTR